MNEIDMPVPRAPVIISIAAILLLAPIVAGGAGSRSDRRRVADVERRTCDDCADLTIFVTNQSFARPDVPIEVKVDGKVVISGKYQVERQHTWVPYQFKVKPGKHALSAASKAGGYRCEGVLDLPRTGWAIVSYWSEGRTPGSPSSLTCEVLDQAPMFVSSATGAHGMLAAASEPVAGEPSARAVKGADGARRSRYAPAAVP